MNRCLPLYGSSGNLRDLPHGSNNCKSQSEEFSLTNSQPSQICGSLLLLQEEEQISIFSVGGTPLVRFYLNVCNILFKFTRSIYSNQRIFYALFYRIGKIVSRFPTITVVLSVIVTLLCAIGIKYLHIENNPQKLWVPDDSDVVTQKNYFDEKFSRFFRVEQIIVTAKVPNDTFGVLRRDVLNELFHLEEDIKNIQVIYDNRIHTLDDICYKPIPSKGCLVQTVTGYYQNDFAKFNASTSDVDQYIFKCVQNDGLTKGCMDATGIPVYYKQVMGAGNFTYNAVLKKSERAYATAFLTSILLKNDDKSAEIAKLWEKEYVKIARRENDIIDVAVSSERSIEDEIEGSTTGDIGIIAISYIAMFVYVAISLGEIHPIRSRVVLGFAGIIIVIMSVIISAGICSLFKVKATLIIMEVIPFLILAIGVDNMFIMANTVDEMSDYKITASERMGKMMGKVGSSMVLASVSEFLAFMLGALTKMPAVQAFCIFAGVAIIANFLLQITAFAALLSLDIKRRDDLRLEIEPFVRAPRLARNWFSIASAIEWFMRRVVAPVVTFPPISALIVVTFITLSGFSIWGASHLRLGLDQKTALPRDSYMVKYFTQQQEYLDIGPPVYFVTK
ncbi:Niemann-Pick C1 protein, partial [Acrasis kona]